MNDAEMHRMYHNENLSLMRIAKRLDCRVSDVRDALGREPPKLSNTEFAKRVQTDQWRHSIDLNEQQRGKRRRVSEVQNSLAAKRKAAVTLPKISILEETQ